MTPFAIQKAFDTFLYENWAFQEKTPVRKTSEDAPAIPYIEGHLLLGEVLGLEIQGHAARPGVFAINIFTRADAGDLEGYAYGGALEKLFWHKTISTIICENGDLMPSTRKIGFDQARQALHFQTTIPFNIIMEY